MSTHETRRQAEREQLKAFAKQHVASLPPEILAELSPLAKLVQAWHAGTDAFGNRFTGEERAAFRRSIDALKRKLADKYGDGKIGAFQYRFHLDIEEVREELAQQNLNIPNP